MNKSKMILRTKFIDRACHWTVVICFFLVALSGIALFFPTLHWLTQTFGTPQMGRILHPFFGVLIFLILMFMFGRFVHHNIPDKKDLPWLKNIVEVLKGNEHKVADVGKYNAGQKMMFWTIMSMISLLLATGVVIWRPYFAHFFPIWLIRWCLLAHATSAIILMLAILVHMYMAFWVKGSIKGMIEGKVSRRWAKKHHPRWYREVEAAEEKQQQ
ncbi:formate dehydrogenase subunit gamma [Kosakonia sacchari]|uniref:formate dehydrogenase-N subunit gamma n=1 Tax=Kosakonia sacchari TaxID=1158459 RepID=UPI00080748D3|nr:formate dehydrogenase-N subunit gamma [Kosakonia sacchari]ANR77464.1 formate dehydrogenase subunit gamma [Kosakonia sacchari]